MPSSRYFLQNIFNKGIVGGNGIGRGFAASVPIPTQPSGNGPIGSPLNATTYKAGMIRPM
jgi:hypothetical protein